MAWRTIVAVADTHLASATPTVHLGSETGLTLLKITLSNNRPLIKFPKTLLLGRGVSRVSLRLWCLNVGVNTTIGVRLILNSRRDWDAGLTGVNLGATWNRFDQDGPTAWTDGGGDFEGATTDTFALTTAMAGTQIEIPLPNIWPAVKTVGATDLVSLLLLVPGDFAADQIFTFRSLESVIDTTPPALRVWRAEGDAGPGPRCRGRNPMCRGRR